MGAQGTVTINFGAAPGTDTATVVVTGQGSIASGSLVEAWIFPDVTADHSEDEHVVDAPIVTVTKSSIVAGTGFTITAVAPQTGGLCYGLWSVAWVWN